MAYSTAMRNTTVIEENISETDEFVEAEMITQPSMEDTQSGIKK